MKNMRSLLYCGTALAVLGASFGAAAQQTKAPGMEEVVVTAQRRSEHLENVPMSVVAVTPERLEKAGIVGMDSLNQIAVGVQLNFASAFFQPAIRGISTLTNGNQAENNVGVYVDGFYEPSSITLNMDLVNLSDIQVLKGPQGTLYGRNATGGAILVNTLGPSKTYTGKFEASYSRFDDKAFTGYVAGPITDAIRFSLSGYFRQTPGYFKKVSPTTIGAYLPGNYGEIKKENVRAKVEFDLSDNLTATLGYSWGFTRDDRGDYLVNTENVASFLPPPPLRATLPGTVSGDFPNFQFSIRNQGTLKLVWKTPIGTLISATGYTAGDDKDTFDFDGTYLPITAFRSKFSEKTFQQSLDYNINAIDKLDLLVGGLYYHDHLGTYPIGGAPYDGSMLISGGQIALYLAEYQKVRSWAIYVDGTYHLTDQWALTVGGRFSSDAKSAELHQRLPNGIYATGPLTDSVTWNKFTPRVSVRYELAPRTNVYAGWQRGFRNGNFNGSGPPAGYAFEPNKPETVDGFEVGFKTAQPVVRFETAAFYYIYKNIQTNIVIPIPNCPAGANCTGSNVFSNAPGAKIYGIDAETTVSPTEDLNVHAGIEWLHARYDTFPNASGTGLNGSTGQNVTNVTQDWSNKRLARAPDFTANLGVDYTVPLANGSLMVAGNVNYSTRFAIQNVSTYDVIVNGVNLAAANLQGQQRFTRPPMALVNASLTWTAPSGNYYVKFYGDNLTNHFYRDAYNGSAFGTYGFRAEPISYGGKVGFKF